jgi:cysteine desulfurase
MACRCAYAQRLTREFEDRSPPSTVYLDCAATTPVDPRVLGVYERSCRARWANPASLHAAGIAAAEALERSRAAAASYFGVNPQGVLFCASATEALFAGMRGLVADRKRTRIAFSAVEHPAVTRNAVRLGQPVVLPVDAAGRIDPLDVQRARAELLVYSPVNHETGAVQDTAALFAAARRIGAIVFLDGAQAAAPLAPRAWAPHCDLFCMAGHKLHSVRGTALLWRRRGLELAPYRDGGGQEEGLFPGTVDGPGAAALAEALAILGREGAAERRAASVLVEELYRLLAAAGVPFEKEAPPGAAPGMTNLSFPQAPGMEAFLLHLHRAGICVSRFSACADSVSGPSAILTAMGRPPARARSSLRVALGRYSRREDILRFVAAAAEAHKHRAPQARRPPGPRAGPAV